MSYYSRKAEMTDCGFLQYCSCGKITVFRCNSCNENVCHDCKIYGDDGDVYCKNCVDDANKLYNTEDEEKTNENL